MQMIVRLDYRCHRAETLGFENGHLLGNVSDYGWLEYVAFVVATGQNARALCNCLVHLFLDERTLSRANQRADNKTWLARVATEFDCRNLRSKTFAEFIVNAGFNNNARTRHADLALMHEITERCGVHCIVDIRIVQDDDRVFAAHFQSEPFAMGCCCSTYLPTYFGRTRESHEPHAGICNQAITNFRT